MELTWCCSHRPVRHRNLERLRTGENGVEVGLVQGGLVLDTDSEQLVTLATCSTSRLDLLPRKSVIEQVSELRGQRVALALPGGGTHALGMAVRRDNGWPNPPTALSNWAARGGGCADRRQHRRGAVRVVHRRPSVQKLLRAPGVHMMNARRADAYIRRLPYLHKLDLPAGVVDLKAGLPSQR